MKKVQFTVTVMLVLFLLSFVSCGEDPFFHYVTLKTDDSGESTEVIQSGDEITLQPAKRKKGKINVWILEGEAKEYRIWDAVKVTGDMTFTCRYVDGYVFEFSANGGSGSVRTEYLKTGESITLPDGKAFARDGYTVAGWNTKADGTGDTYKSGDKITPSSDLELYILWADGSDGEGGGSSGGEGGGKTPTESSDYASFLKAYGASVFILDDFAGGVINAKENDKEEDGGGSTFITSVTWDSSELSKLTDLFTNEAKSERLNIKSYSEASGTVKYGFNMVEADKVTFKIVYQKQTSTDGTTWTDTGDEIIGYVVMNAKRTRTAVTGAAAGTYSCSVTGITLSVIPDANGDFMNVDGKTTVSYPDITYTMTGSDVSTLTDVKIAGTSLSSDALARTKTSLACSHAYTQTYTAAKCEAAGSIALTCSKCKYTQTTTIPALGHSYILSSRNGVTNSISCKGQGHVWEKCSREGCTSTIDNRINADPNAHIVMLSSGYSGFMFDKASLTIPTSTTNGSIKVTHSTASSGCGATEVVLTTSFDSDLIGTWKTSNVTLTIKSDGTCTFSTPSIYSESGSMKNWSVVPGASNSVMEYKILYLTYDSSKTNNTGIAIPYVYSADKKQISTMFGILTKSES